MPNFLTNINLPLLLAQKAALLDVMEIVEDTQRGEHLEGILNLLDKIHDQLDPPEPKQQWICENCGSYDVEHRVWQHLNNGKISGETSDKEDTWCNSCQKHGYVKLDQ